MWDHHPVRLALVHMLPEVAAQRGLAVEPLLARAGIGGRLEGDRSVSRGQVSTLLQELARQAGEPAIGLTLAAHADPSRLGLSGQALFAGRTLRECLHAHARHMPTLQGGVHLALDERDGRAHWRHVLADSDPAHARVLNEGIAAFMAAALRAIVGETNGTLHVSLPHRAEVPARTYEDQLAAGVSFGNGSGVAIAFDAAWLDRPNPWFEIELPAAGTEQPEPRAPLDDTALIEALHRIVVSASISGTLSLLDTARCLGLAPRSLQRRLALLGTSFEALVDTWRHAEALRRLADPGLPVGIIARMLGYRDPAHFVRAFRRWEGRAPLTHRRDVVARNGN